jgi:hypothetical protein
VPIFCVICLIAAVSGGEVRFFCALLQARKHNEGGMNGHKIINILIHMKKGDTNLNKINY